MIVRRIVESVSPVLFTISVSVTPMFAACAQPVGSEGDVEVLRTEGTAAPSRFDGDGLRASECRAACSEAHGQ